MMERLGQIRVMQLKPGANMTDSVYLDLTPTSTYQSGGTKVLSGIRITYIKKPNRFWQISGSNTGGTYKFRKCNL